ncbi:MAG: WYL domain-containing protein [Oscillospiraceae bacterium]
MYESLNRGEIIDKKKFAEDFQISAKSVQRDIDDLRAYLAEKYESSSNVTIEYDYELSGYKLVKQERDFLTNEEILVISKILLESRGLINEELNPIMNKLMLQATPTARENIKELIKKEQFNYIAPKHGKLLLNKIGSLSLCIHHQEVISFDYIRMDNKAVHRTVEPLAIMFSEFYFYLIAWFSDHSKDFPAVFRIDRIDKIEKTGDKFKIPYKDKFNDGEFRKRIFFMFQGPLNKIKFEFSGPSIEALLDKIPTAKIISRTENTYTIEAESYGNGILMWLRTQGEWVKILE